MQMPYIAQHLRFRGLYLNGAMTELSSTQRYRKTQPPRTELSFQDRLYIIQTVNGLPSAQFEELCFALNPPNGVVPPDNAPQGNRAKALLDWAEGSTGPGLLAVDQGLQTFVPKIIQPEQSPRPVAFAVSGKMGELSPEELEAIVQLLRQKTGDDSIELAFVTEGSIRLVLNGSAEGLEKLQELFDSGDNVLEGHSVEYAHPIESDATEARKARLLQVLRVYTERSNLTRARNLALGQTRALEIALDLNQALNLALDLNLDLNQPLNLERALELNRALEQALERARALDIAGALDIARALNLERTRDFVDLRHADLSGANLRELDLRGISLEGTNLTDADVTGTLFGDNPGLTESDKRDLQRRGAIFQDPPSSDVPSLVLA